MHVAGVETGRADCRLAIDILHCPPVPLSIADVKELEIYCPRCGWRPTAEDRWVCTPQCGTVWNTFWTRGLCPGCAKQWDDTQCLECGRHSPHKHWYHVPDSHEQEREKERELVAVD